MIVDPAASSIHDIEKLLVGVILPRPIAFVSTLSPDGVAESRALQLLHGGQPQPAGDLFLYSIRARDGSKKDTLRNIEATGEFVVNVVSEDFAAQMMACSGDYPPEVDEFDISGLTPIRERSGEAAARERVARPDGVPAGAGRHGQHEPGGGSLVMGEVVRFHVDDSVIANGTVDPDKLRADRPHGRDHLRPHYRPFCWRDQRHKRLLAVSILGLIPALTSAQVGVINGSANSLLSCSALPAGTPFSGRKVIPNSSVTSSLNALAVRCIS